MTALVQRITVIGVSLGFLLKSSAPGRPLINTTDTGVFNIVTNIDTQKCRPCGVTTYIIDQMHGCMRFPKGTGNPNNCQICPSILFLENPSVMKCLCVSVVVVVCLCCPNFLSLPCVITDCPDGIQFLCKVVGRLTGSVESGGNQWRISRYPSGYELNRDPSLSELDDRDNCTKGFYRLKPVNCQGHRDDLPVCYTCPKGENCPGGDIVETKGGYCRLETQSSGDYEYLESTVQKFIICSLVKEIFIKRL
jgi:hypothetical protein